MKTTIRIATGQYEYLEVEGTEEDIPQLLKLQNQYSEKPVQFKTGQRRTVECFVGGVVYYDDDNHAYYNEAGDKLLSGSEYAKQFEKPFDGQMMSSVMAKKAGVKAKDIQKMWDLKRDISAGFGTAIHAALELYGRYDGLAKSLEKTTHLHDHPIIKKAVESFYAGRENEKAEYEIFIVDNERKRAGQVDRLLITGDKTCRIQDYKTNATIEKKLEVYWKQLSFYAGIMKSAGWTVEGLDIFHWDGTWHTYHKEPSK